MAIRELVFDKDVNRSKGVGIARICSDESVWTSFIECRCSALDRQKADKIWRGMYPARMAMRLHSAMYRVCVSRHHHRPVY